MPSKPSRSIARQLIYLFTPAAVCLLLVGLIIFYLIVTRHAAEEDRAFLNDKIGAIRAELKRPGGLEVLANELKVARAGEQPDYWIRLLDRDNYPITERPGMDKLLPQNVFPQSENSADLRIGNKRFSLRTATVIANSYPYHLQIAQDRSEDAEFTLQLAILIAVLLPLGICASAVIAVIVTRRSLRPLTEMTHSFQRIGPHHLHERVPPATWPRELQPLAVAFDDMLERLEDSFTRLSQFSADLAHELRTPIANMLGEAQVALTRQRSTDEYRQVVESAVAECERLSGIIDNLLFLARSEAATNCAQKKLLDGRAEVEKLASIYRTLAEEEGVTIISEGEAQIHADRVLFERVLSNVIENALRFTPAGGRIHIALQQRDNCSEVIVSDTGSGIPAEHLPRVFDRFYQVDRARSAGGAGLGLALVKSIMELHGGRVEIESQVGKGTKLKLLFPSLTT